VYVLVCGDLTVAQQAVQGMHAALEAARQGLIPADVDHPHLVFCVVSDEDELERVARRLRVDGLRYALFREPDLGDRGTALCTALVEPAQRRLFRRYPLFVPYREGVKVG
jgi:hypothetical protein